MDNFCLVNFKMVEYSLYFVIVGSYGPNHKYINWV